MITTEFMGLTAWDQEKDDFEHSELSDNFIRIDQHDHAGKIVGGAVVNGELDPGTARWESNGEGRGIGTLAILPEAIERYLIKLRAVSHFQVALEGIWSENIKERAVETKHVKKENITDELIAKGTITIDKLAEGVIPLGQVTMWYKAYPTAKPGSNWAICNGEAWNKITNTLGPEGNPLTEGTIPDMRGKFARGNAEGTPAETGGNASTNLKHGHTATVPALTVGNHIHSIANHRHVIAEAGSHNHTFAGGYKMHTRQNAFTNEVELKISGHPNTYESLYVAAPFFDHDGEWIGKYDEEVLMDVSGLHTHGGGFTATTELGNTGGAEPKTNSEPISTNEALGTVNTEPPWVGFAFIMRVQ